ncbi:Leucine-rich repeat family protein [Cucumis melo var. makuwa]|uniref:Leucine-rich repeat family protein n=1 Tax=Cucumis melo var. makuwa TaxID=1194695 RepID=A0A5D3CLZ6_CUCMM|nr:Leucine-rich repeat family protein [Cucumis melo var. makuwa]
MGGGNGQKSKMAREKNMEKLKASSKGEKSARSKQESNVYSGHVSGADNLIATARVEEITCGSTIVLLS